MAGEHAIEGYRAFWLLLAAYFYNCAGRSYGLDSDFSISDSLAAGAVSAAQPATWIREVLPFPGRAVLDRPTWDKAAISRLVDDLKSINVQAHDRRAEEMRKGLQFTAPGLYEPALSILGRLLGAESYKPPDDGQCDSAWCWEDALWLTVEAKSDESSSGLVPLQDVRQTNSQLALLSSNRSESIPPQSASTIMTPRQAFAPEAVTASNPNVFYIMPRDILTLADDATKLWDALIVLRHSDDVEANRLAVESILSDMRLFPSDVLERLTTRPVGDVS